MDQVSTGRFIATKRKELNLTQEQLADKIGVTNKTISKWETGKCMPDYSVVQSLCKELAITISELMDGEEKDSSSMRVYDDTQIMDLLKRTQDLERQRNSLYALLLIVMGAVLLAVSQGIGGTSVKDFFSGVLLGLAIGEMLVGVFLVGRSLSRKSL